MNNIIEVKDISRHYSVGKQTVKALDSITVDIKRNEYVFSIGTFRKSFLHIGFNLIYFWIKNAQFS